MKPKIINTETFSCANDHPIVWYRFGKDGKIMCEYCATHFVYEPKDFHTKMLEEKELLDMSMKESFRQRDERIEKENSLFVLKLRAGIQAAIPLFKASIIIFVLVTKNIGAIIIGCSMLSIFFRVTC